MPIPTPSKNEEQKKFHDRCMSDDVMLNEYPDKDRRNAVCFSRWHRKKEKDKKVAKELSKAAGKGRGQGGPPQGDSKDGKGAPRKCVCPKCGHEMDHRRDAPCTETKCPKCGAVMQGSEKKEKSAISASIRAPIIKADEERRIAYLCVMEPDTVDAQGDITDPIDIEKALHLYMAQYRKVGLLHESILDDSFPVEAYIAPQDLTFDWNGIKTEIKKGSAIVGVYVGEDAVWKRIKSGELSGASITGSAVRVLVE